MEEIPCAAEDNVQSMAVGLDYGLRVGPVKGQLSDSGLIQLKAFLICLPELLLAARSFVACELAGSHLPQTPQFVLPGTASIQT